MSSSRSTLVFLSWYVAIIGVCIVAALTMHSFEPEEMRALSLSTWEVFYDVLGIIYAIVVGFILAELLGRFSDLKTLISKELNNLECIRDLLIYVDENRDAKENILAALRAYATSISDVEWASLRRIAIKNGAQKARSEESDTNERLYALMRAVETIRCIDESDRLVLGQIIAKIADVTVFRTQRYESSSSSLSPILKYLVVFLSFVLIVGIILAYVPSIIVHLFMIVAMTTAVFLLYAVITDLNNPYAGIWRIDPTPFSELAKTLTLAHYEMHDQAADDAIPSD